jgi:hypothetical protein
MDWVSFLNFIHYVVTLVYPKNLSGILKNKKKLATPLDALFLFRPKIKKDMAVNKNRELPPKEAASFRNLLVKIDIHFFSAFI